MSQFVIVPDSVNGYAESQTLRVTDEMRADLFFYTTIRNNSNEALELETNDITLACRKGHRLLYVDQPHSLNDGKTVPFRPEEEREVRIFFLVPGGLCNRVSQASEVTLRVGHDVWSGKAPWILDLA